MRHQNIKVNSTDLRDIRQGKKITQSALASRIGVSQQAYSRFEQDCFIPLDRAKQIAKALGCSLSDFTTIEVTSPISKSPQKRDERISHIAHYLFGASDSQIRNVESILGL